MLCLVCEFLLLKFLTFSTSLSFNFTLILFPVNLVQTGYYSDAQNMKVCYKCPLGYFANSQLSVSGKLIFDRCQSCPRGTVGSKTQAHSFEEGCQNCTAGKFSEYESVASLAGCKGCPKGTWSSASGMIKESACKNCVTGQYGQDSTGADSVTSCSDCDAGKYLGVVGSFGIQSCVQCPQGFSQKDAGQAFCLPCAPSTFTNQEGRSVCKNCAVGRSSTEIARTTKCDSCSPGRNQPTEGTTTCLDCIPGRYQVLVESVRCIECDVGQASFKVAQESPCDNCSTGRHQPESGMTGKFVLSSFVD